MMDGTFAVADSRIRMLHLIAAQSQTVHSLRPSSGFALMLRFFETEQPWGLDDAPEADALLFEWGTFDSGRTGVPLFELVLTRQFILAEGADARGRAVDKFSEGIAQLVLAFRYDVTELTRGLGSGSEWFYGETSMNDLLDSILLGRAVTSLAKVAPAMVELVLDTV